MIESLSLERSYLSTEGVDALVACETVGLAQHDAVARGRSRPTLRIEAEDVQLRFPGRQLLGPARSGKREHAHGSSGSPASGCRSSPTRWSSRASRGTRPCASAATTTCARLMASCVYENRYVIWGRMSWGQLRSTRSTRTLRRQGPRRLARRQRARARVLTPGWNGRRPGSPAEPRAANRPPASQ